jgi:hypothetical protein
LQGDNSEITFFVNLVNLRLIHILLVTSCYFFRKHMAYSRYYDYRISSGVQALILDIINVSRNLLLRIFFGRYSKRILFYPQFPDWSSDIYQTLFTSLHRITTRPKKKFDYLINWEDATFRTADETLVKLSKDHYVLNMGCTDISKRTVERIFQEVFGYSSFIDPLTFKGKIIEKNNLNSKHSQIKMLLAPLKSVKDDFVYQRFISNIQGNYFIDYRTPCINGEVPMVLVRHKPPDKHILAVSKYKVAAPSQVYTDTEIIKIRDFCSKIKLEYGELDIIRDEVDNQIYIIDVNTTPHRPHAALSKADRKKKINTIRKLLLEHLAANSIKFKSEEPGKKILHHDV